MEVINGLAAVRDFLAARAPALADDDKREATVRRIVSEVRRRGDAALINYTMEFDGVKLESMEVSQEQIAAAADEVDAKLLAALRLAAERINAFYMAQRDGLRGIDHGDTGQLVRPLARVGVYAPGGTASYPSTVLMTAIPARVAGVKEVLLVTPPGRDGKVPMATLAAAEIAEVDRVFSVGGAQAVAALAYGTETIPRVDKICGPGNIFVVLAKRLVFGMVGIDGLYGPSEVVIIADETADPGYCAADILAQAEHDPLASAILITTSPVVAEMVNREIERQLENLPRRAIITESLNAGGRIMVVDNMAQALEVVDFYAPEHLCLMVSQAASYLDRVGSAGCIFIGGESTVVFGDYVAGPSHVLPTGGTARFGSPLNITDFVKLIDLVDMGKADRERLGQAAATIARAEGMEAHARAVEKRLEAKH